MPSAWLITFIAYLMVSQCFFCKSNQKIMGMMQCTAIVAKIGGKNNWGSLYFNEKSQKKVLHAWLWPEFPPPFC